MILESAFNNTKFTFSPFLTISIRTNWNCDVLDYSDSSLADGRMVLLLYAILNFIAENDVW